MSEIIKRDDSDLEIPEEFLEAEREAKRAGRTKAKPKHVGYADALRRSLEDDFCGEMSEALAAAFIVLRKRLKAEAEQIVPVEPTKAGKPHKTPLPKPLQDMLDDDDFWEDVGADVKAAFRANATAIIREAAKYKMSLGIAVDMNTLDTWMIKFTRDYTNWWWDGLSKTTRDGLREALTTWQETGFGKRGFEDLVKSVGDVFFDVDAAGNPIADPVRARMIATTETTNLFDEGNREAERGIGVVEQEWMTCEDEWVCTVLIFYKDEVWQGCADLNGKRFPIDEGPFPARDTHPNCRCGRVGVAPNGEVMKD